MASTIRSRWSAFATSCPLRRWLGGGSSPQIRGALAQINAYVDAGLNHLVFHGPGADQMRFLDQFSEDVVPGLRALA